MMELIEAIRTIPGLGAGARQVVILMTGARYDAAYEIYAHAASAKEAGLTDAQITTLLAGHRPADLDGEQGLAADVTAALLRGGVLPEPLYARARAELGQDGLDAIVLTTAQYSFVGVMLNAYDVPGEARADPA